MNRFISALALSLLLLPGAAVAEIEDRVLFQHRDWMTYLQHDTDTGGLWCVAATANNSGQTFDITMFDAGVVALYVIDPNWSLASRVVNFFVDIDYSRWQATGEAAGTSVEVVFNDVDAAIAFTRQLMGGSAVAVYNSDGSRLATFSLSGSAAAVVKLLECYESIRGNVDPFGASSDPF